MTAATTEIMDTASDCTFSYQPPPGGDILLKSSDGTIFLAHSLFLQHASSVFAGMFSTATQSDPVQLSDDAESVSLMLRFIYPPTFLDNLPVELLEKSLRIAQKYDISGIITSVDHVLMTHSSNEYSLISLDPLRAFCLATEYKLPKTQKAAMAGLRPEQYTFDEPKDIETVAKIYTSAAGFIGLLGAHSVRIHILLGLLIGDNRDEVLPMLSENSTRADVMMCRKCFDGEEYEIGDGITYEPSWYTHWRIMALDSLSVSSIDECFYLFRDNILNVIVSRPAVCADCVRAAETASAGRGFRTWVEKTKYTIMNRLRPIESLYNL
ncbi:hypothetical protein FRC07_004762 [Ceratobasidium sp. 392]|nr:hypothetical protein FRC07_004762 [Ceratobasidium sp. 392]